MSLLAPLGALGLIAVPVIVTLYVLRVRRPDVMLSSTLLWRRSVRDRQASVPWQRLQPSWLLFLQVLAAILLVLALMRPALAVQSELAGHTIVVIDAAGPMQATDVSPSRFEVARGRARELIDRVGPQDRMTLIAMDDRPRVLASASGDPGPLRTALDRLQPSAGTADLQQTLALALGAAGAGRDTLLVLLSDGVTSGLHEPLRLPFPVRYEPIGQGGENLAVTALTVSGQGSARSATAHVQNTGRARRTTTVELRADGRLVDARPIEVEPGGARDAVFTLPPGTDHVVAELSPHDVLALDDQATAIARPPRTLHVVLVTARNLFLQRALSLRPDVRLTTVSPAAYRADPTADLLVFDGMLPPQPPEVPYWLVGPPADRGSGIGGEIAPGRLRPAAAADALVDGLDLSGVHVAQARDLRGSAFGRTVLEGGAGPVLQVRDATPRAALLGFDVHDSDLPLRPAFPVLVDRITGFLLPALLPPRSHAPGEPVEIPAGRGVNALRVTRPDGASAELAVRGGSAVDDDTEEPGLYRAEAVRASGAPERSEFAVNSADATSAGITPLDRLPVSGTGSAATAAAAGSAQEELWPWLAAAAIALLLIEWTVFHRGA